MSPIKFKLNPTYIREQMWFEDFRDGGHGCHLGYQDGTIWAIPNFNVAPMTANKFRLYPTYQITIDYFQDGHSCSHLGYYSEIILAILNFYVASMPPTKFWFILTYYSEADVVWSFSRWPSWLTIEDSLDGCHCCRLGYREKNDFKNSKFICCPNASHQVTPQSDLPSWSKWGLKIFKIATVVAILDIGTERF